MIIWDWIKDKKPQNISLKSRMEEDIMVVYGKPLEMSYLNKIGARILNLSDGSNSVEDIANILLKIYDVDEKNLQDDIIVLMRELQWKRIIKLEE